MEYRRFNIILAVTCLFLCSLSGMTNYVVDSYGIFRTDFSRQKRPPNQHFIKMRHVIANPSRYDSFLFGSSRVGKIDVSLIKDGRFYNLYYAEAVPAEYLKDLKILLSEGVKIRNVLIGLDDFSVMSPQDFVATAQTITGGLTIFLGGIAAISLLVGGIGIMNIMLVSVTERTREIGLRKAVGAKRGDILVQFLTEAIVISALGGLIGLEREASQKPAGFHPADWALKSIRLNSNAALAKISA